MIGDYASNHSAARQKLFTFDEYVEFSHDWVQTCGALCENSVCGKYAQGEQYSYDIYKARQREEKFVANKFKE